MNFLIKKITFVSSEISDYLCVTFILNKEERLGRIRFTFSREKIDYRI